MLTALKNLKRADNTLTSQLEARYFSQHIHCWPYILLEDFFPLTRAWCHLDKVHIVYHSIYFGYYFTSNMDTTFFYLDGL